MPKIKVIELIPSLGAGGAEHFVLDLCRCLDPARFEVLLVSFWRGKKRPDVSGSHPAAAGSLPVSQ